MDHVAKSSRYGGTSPYDHQSHISHKSRPPLCSLYNIITPKQVRDLSVKQVSISDLDRTQVDYVISKISGIYRKAENIRNSFAPINKLPPEILALIATFFEPGRQLIDVTAVCRYWRAALLSFPRLWGRITCSNELLFKTYLERSKAVPLEVRLPRSLSRSLASLVPHTSRLASLTVSVTGPSTFEQLARHLNKQIPTLHEFSIVVCSGTGELKIPADINNDHFLHVRTLRLVQVSSLRAPCVFPRVTELEWIARSRSFMPLLEMLAELPALERVEITFQGFYTPLTHAHLVTLPNVQRMSLHCTDGKIPDLLEFLKLPSLTSLVVDGVQNLPQSFSILPVTPFGKNIPNFAQLPEMEVATYHQPNRVSFRSPSRATLDYYIEPLSLGRRRYSNYRKIWGGFPVDSIRKLVVEADTGVMGGEDGWVASLLRDLRSLEHLAFRSHCGRTPQYLRRMIMEAATFSEMKSLTVYLGSQCEARQVHRLEDVVGGLNSGISVTWIKDSGVPDEKQ